GLIVVYVLLVYLLFRPRSGRGGAALITSPQIRILNARYGAESQWLNVTKAVQTIVIHNQGDVVASTSILGVRDPIYGIRKTLEVRYMLDGQEFSVSIPEDQTQSLAQ